MSDEEVRRARAYLSRVGEPGDRALWWLVEQAGPVEAAEAVRRGHARLGDDSPAAVRRGRIDVDADLESAQRHDIRLLIPEDPDWPHFALSAMHWQAASATGAGAAGGMAPPLALWVKGPLDAATLAVRSAAIVGARAATDYGSHVASDLAYDVAGRGIPVVSGGAFGIDAAAHRAALAAGGATILVSAAGLDRPYPVAHNALYEQVAALGLLVSESPPGSAPYRRRFLSRNRLIAAFGSGTVVVEAGRRSGALSTAACARRLGRPVMAVPGPVTSAMSMGCHDLLRRDAGEDAGATARLVTCARDVLAEISTVPGGDLERGRHGGHLVAGDRPPRDGSSDDEPHRDAAPGDDVRREVDALSAEEAAVYDALRPRAWSTEDELSLRSGAPIAGVRRTLASLVVRDLAQVGPLGFRLAPRAAQSARSGSR